MKKVLLLLADGFESYEASVFTDVLGWNLYEGSKNTAISSVGMHKTLRCTWGYSCIPDYQLTEINLDNFDALAIPGGFEEAGFYKDAYSEEFLNVISYFNSRNKPIAAICVAALSLGKSGILTGRKATTYMYQDEYRLNQLKNMHVLVVKEKNIVVDRNVVTSASPATAIDVAFWLLEQLTNKQNVISVKRRMGFMLP
ncbi:DJ-1/PfpI family protein [Ligilactobacillus sp. WILCCON 0076]|uniref:DJ-1/PfpI family protein n=1 Tax=Ligilactobacillus ubinensis TaxID=2876789 RepID=A0A9X2FHZ3_9LACO|nr:DJ-1/PfpI family protein [Ligilactobacillus ubinensis]MCP0886055.1 DJ-1/PfpI family protein [Ligilactobacillus ubinensis]